MVSKPAGFQPDVFQVCLEFIEPNLTEIAAWALGPSLGHRLLGRKLAREKPFPF